MHHVKTTIFALGVIFALSPWAGPPLALALGIAYALIFAAELPTFARKHTKLLLQCSVVLLGFGMDLGHTLSVGGRSFLFTSLTIISTLLLGHLLGKALRLDSRRAVLVSAGTAICGGSAIAAVAAALNSDDADVSVALATVFVLNAAALYLFPFLGVLLGLSPTDFGAWAGIGIHDVSSVVGAASAYDKASLGVATAVKLSRTLWIAPMVIALAWLYNRNEAVKAAGSEGGKFRIPSFILFFLLASALRSLVPVVAEFSPSLVAVARSGLTLTLFLIGAGLSRKILRRIGPAALLHGLILWAFISAISLLVITTSGSKLIVG